MPHVIIVRLTPSKPTSGADFTRYLTNLTIKLYDLSFGAPADGAYLGEASGVWVPNTGDAASGPAFTPATQKIIQHFTIIPPHLPERPDYYIGLNAVATAIIPVTLPAAEFNTSDLRLEILQAGVPVAYDRLDFNVQTLPDAPLVANPVFYMAIDPPAVVVALPDPAAGATAVLLPEDGSPPRFLPLVTAIDAVLAQDPGGTTLASRVAGPGPLTLTQARHIAREIAWNRQAAPPPARPHDRKLEDMYTRPETAIPPWDEDTRDKADMDRLQYEASLLGYYALQDATAERLAQYVFSASAAVWAEQRSARPGRIGLRFPIDVGAPPLPGATFREAEVVIADTPPLELDFTVPAAYLYALSVTLPASIAPAERYRMATDDKETHLVSTIKAAAEAGTIALLGTIALPGTTAENAARRLVAIGRGRAQRPMLAALDAQVAALVTAWLAYMEPSIDSFWQRAVFTDAMLLGHLDLVLAVVLQQTALPPDPAAPTALMAAIKAIPVRSAAQLKAIDATEWRRWFLAATGAIPPDRVHLLPEFTKPGTPEERIAAFVRRLRKFFEVQTSALAPLAGPASALPSIRRDAGDPVDAFLAALPGFGVPVANWSDPGIAAALATVFPGDADAQAWLLEALRTLDELSAATTVPAGTTALPLAPASLRFSLMEALYARGFRSRAQIRALAAPEFAHALTGTIAYGWVEKIQKAAGGASPLPEPGAAGPFAPVNPDASLVNCIPPWHLSPFGPVKYLQDLLATGIGATCEQALASGATLATLIAPRRGAPGTLLATAANVHTPIPLIDIVNENLEHLADGGTSGIVHDSGGTTLGSHALRPAAAGEADHVDGHRADQLFAALPEHSSPAAPGATPNAYVRLASDFSAPALPYAQTLDVSRTYLRAMGVSRYATMRAFRENITEFALDASAEAPDFQKHLWRYPVRIELALEYLCLSPAEYETLYRATIAPAALRTMYGFTGDTLDGVSWKVVVLRVPQFLKRTGLDYCDFLDLWESGFVALDRAPPPVVRGVERDPDSAFPRCEPCCPEDLVIGLRGRASLDDALRRLMVFIRLWRSLRCVAGARYSFAELADIAQVLGLFSGTSINPEFIRQLAAFQILRDDWGLDLGGDPDAAPGAQGADRTRLLGLWAGPAHPSFAWAVEHLLARIQDRAEREQAHGAGPGQRHRHRAPEFMKIVRANLDALSVLAGFAPASAPWHALPAGTLRFAEILSKIYASSFTTGELLFLFSVDQHLDGADPFFQQDRNEALDQPFDYPEEGHPFDLWRLRQCLLEVRVCDEQVDCLDWYAIDSAMRADFGYDPAPGSDPLRDLANHFFPAMMARLGLDAGAAGWQYRTSLAATSPGMWNQPPNGPFQYDPAAGELVAALPLCDCAVLAKLNAIEQLTPAEMQAVQQLYFSPRAALAQFSFLFPDLGCAEQALIEEADEACRWAYFARCFLTLAQRAHAVAAHLACHVAHATDRHEVEPALAALILRSLRGDENQALTPWETDDGMPPASFLWPLPAGGAYAALTALAGTGLFGEYRSDSGATWQETRGPMTAFTPARSNWNAPVPTVIPRLDLTLPAARLKFAILRNGFAMRESDGLALGGAEGFTVRWRGVLIVEQAGAYTFFAGAPSPDCAPPDFEACGHQRWRVNLRRGQKTWLLLNYRWEGEQAPDHTSVPLHLKRGAYFLDIDIEESAPEFDEKLELAPARSGFTLKYAGADTCGSITAIPNERLYRDLVEAPLQGPDTLAPAAHAYLELQYSGSLRDVRRTYQRAFKALLLAHRLRLSSRLLARASVSEMQYLLSAPELFAGVSYVPGSPYSAHRAWFDLNLLPVGDVYNGDPERSPAAAPDARSAPSVQRRQALFDWFERLHDYSVMRRAVAHKAGRQAWLTFVEASNQQAADVLPLLSDLGIDLDHAPLLLEFYNGVTPGWQMLADERWPVRLWHASLWVRQLLRHVVPLELGAARPSLWATDADASLATANAELTAFYRNGMIERGDPRRYADIESLNNALRERARSALLAYLTSQDRVALPFAPGSFARTPGDLSALLLLDVEAGICQTSSRIEEALSALQAFVERARLSLEPTLPVTAAFSGAWDKLFASFRVWQACRRRTLYRENYVEWAEHGEAVRTEAFRLLERELRRATFSAPAPGGMQSWPGPHWPAHPDVILSQEREPAHLAQLAQPENLGLMGRPERHARPTWLAPSQRQLDQGGNTPEPPPATDPVLTLRAATMQPPRLPLWIEAAVRLGTRFLRIAAAGEPPAWSRFAPPHMAPGACCAQCGEVHPPVMDEYYFWLVDGKYYDPASLNPDRPDLPQDAAWGATPADTTSDWHRPDKLPQLLSWPSKKMVRLAWCRVHNGQFQTPRYSDGGAHVAAGPGEAELEFTGREGDTLRFTITHAGPTPQGYADTSPWGFRYDMAPDTAVVLPQVLAPAPLPGGPAGLAAYPFFVFFAPGAPLEPSLYATSMTVAAALRSNCRHEAALKWYERYYAPAGMDLRWSTCRNPGRGPNDPALPQPPVVRGRARADAVRTAGTQDGAARLQPVGTRQDPCCDTLTYNAADARRRSTLLAYVETLLEHAGVALCRNSAEGYALARLRLDTAARYLGERPRTLFGHDDGPGAPTVAALVPRFAPLNPRLMDIYDRLDDQLGALHRCLDRARLAGGALRERRYWGDPALRRGWQEVETSCLDDDACCCPSGPYRFPFLLQRALETAGEVRTFGAALLAAYEKGDAEFLAAMRVSHEREMANLAEEIRQMEWREADMTRDSLRKALQAAQTRRQYYADLIAGGLIGEEQAYRNLTQASMASRTAGNVVEAIAQVMNLIPDMTTGVAGVASTPVSVFQMPIGTKLAHAFSAASRILLTVGDVLGTEAGLAMTDAGWVRREVDWVFQVSVLDVEIEQIERQILAAERRRDAALRQLNSQVRQMQQAADVQDFLRDKFTNHALYLFLQQETAALHRQMFDIAWCWARQAQRAFQFERELGAQHFLAAQPWDGLHEALLAGEGLSTALRTMEKAYFDQNRREQELVTRMSLRMDFPLAFLELKATGACEVEIPEWRFDREYPGHYLRRIKSLNLTIPAVTGPGTGVHCKLTLLGSATRVDPALSDIEDCCPGACTCGCCGGKRYRASVDDPRIVKRFGATEAIATSSGQNDAGLFELNFRDERYLPFEFAGAVSRWRIELPMEHNAFDVDSVSDVLFQMSYTAREGGSLLREASWAAASCILPGGALRFFDWRQDFSESWQRFKGKMAPPDQEHGCRALGLRMSRAMFPYLPGERPVRMRRLDIWFETCGGDGVRNHEIEFVPDPDCACEHDSEACCERYLLTCVASVDWPCLYHGVLEYPFPWLDDECPVKIGEFLFPHHVGPLRKAYLVCSYEAGAARRCLPPGQPCATGCTTAC
ncbi:insecticidal toxin complex protein [Massilia sp. CCM 8695]|uniref:Insecticidal toxin complex protein n=1 Tax=Massilia frigida TaxID=2609281 RepID=A0ABX0NFQ1_9BURK|nr:neuraminidase-like domain-containing protein [Massilia frigida]NHZ81412.1 insecticidal toxin complex protein [Massilia frigida]